MPYTSQKGNKRQPQQEASQDLDNQSFDPAFGTYVNQIVGSPDGVNLYQARVNSDGSLVGADTTYGVQIDPATSTVTYIGKALPGTATSAASWQIKKIDTTSGTIITWASGNSNFVNVYDNRASLSYS